MVSTTVNTDFSAKLLALLPEKENSVISPFGIATVPLYADAFTQKAEIQVDKNGTVAVAITYMTLCLKGGISSCDRFRFNKPFSYFLQSPIPVIIYLWEKQISCPIASGGLLLLNWDCLTNINNLRRNAMEINGCAQIVGMAVTKFKSMRAGATPAIQSV